MAQTDSRSLEAFSAVVLPWLERQIEARTQDQKARLGEQESAVQLFSQARDVIRSHKGMVLTGVVENLERQSRTLLGATHRASMVQGELEMLKKVRDFMRVIADMDS